MKNIPVGGDVFLFLLSDGKVHKPVELPEQITLGHLITEYEESVADSLEESTRYTIGVHTRHLKRLLGEALDPCSINLQRLDDYIRTRQGEQTQRGTNVTSATVRKEITTLRAIWNWSVGRYELGDFPSVKKLSYAKSDEKPPFQTYEQIHRQIECGGLTDQQQHELWEALFLSLNEVAELLKYVRKAAVQPFVYTRFPTPSLCAILFTLAAMPHRQSPSKRPAVVRNSTERPQRRRISCWSTRCQGSKLASKIPLMRHCVRRLPTPADRKSGRCARPCGHSVMGSASS
ncbi:MAG: hypothetical protein EA424_08530 [Planctomycetaceae bacterium]|nr:MAG: hypothetical protein EA424_08530 [Planctomycetaceae bacterium]